MNDLLKQLQFLVPLAAAATAGHWQAGYDSEESCYRITAPIGGSEIEYYLCTELEEEDAAFIAAARNVLTPKNLTALCAALAPQWVAVTERMPEESGVYLVFGNCTGKDDLPPTEDMATFYIEAATFSKYRQPTHWMPLPAAPATMEGSPAHE